jgi:hypothetical protein
MSTIKVKTINKQVIKPIPIEGQQDTRPILGADLFEEIYANIALIAKKKSGKTTTLHHILKRCAGKDTHVIFFCSTIHKDKSYVGIRKMLKERGISFDAYTSLKEDGVDVLDDIVKELEEEAKKREEEAENGEEQEVKKETHTTDDLLQALQTKGIDGYIEEEEKEETKKKKKSKYRMPELIIVLDDLSNQLRSPSLETLLKKNRHFFCKVIISTQYIHDLAPESLKQLDYWIIFRGQPIEKLEKIYKDADLNIDFSLFYNIYKDATKDKFGFLYIDTNNMNFRKNFNKVYILPND